MTCTSSADHADSGVTMSVDGFGCYMVSSMPYCRPHAAASYWALQLLEVGLCPSHTLKRMRATWCKQEVHASHMVQAGSACKPHGASRGIPAGDVYNICAFVPHAPCSMPHHPHATPLLGQGTLYRRHSSNRKPARLCQLDEGRCLFPELHRGPITITRFSRSLHL